MKELTAEHLSEHVPPPTVEDMMSECPIKGDSHKEEKESLR